MDKNVKGYKKLTLAIHNRHRKKNWFSRWLMSKPTRMAVNVQAFKGRLYFVGFPDCKKSNGFDFEETLTRANNMTGQRFIPR